MKSTQPTPQGPACKTDQIKDDHGMYSHSCAKTVLNGPRKSPQTLVQPFTTHELKPMVKRARSQYHKDHMQNGPNQEIWSWYILHALCKDRTARPPEWKYLHNSCAALVPHINWGRLSNPQSGNEYPNVVRSFVPLDNVEIGWSKWPYHHFTIRKNIRVCTDSSLDAWSAMIDSSRSSYTRLTTQTGAIDLLWKQKSIYNSTIDTAPDCPQHHQNWGKDSICARISSMASYCQSGRSYHQEGCNRNKSRVSVCCWCFSLQRLNAMKLEGGRNMRRFRLSESKSCCRLHVCFGEWRLITVFPRFPQIYLDGYRGGSWVQDMTGQIWWTSHFIIWDIQEGLTIWAVHLCEPRLLTLPETNSSHLKMDGWLEYDCFLLGFCPIFRCVCC